MEENRTDEIDEKTFNYMQLFKIADGFEEDLRGTRYKYFKKRTDEILSHLNFNIKMYRKGNAYKFPLDISAIIIVIEMDNGNKQDDLVYKIKNGRYSDITGKDILILLYKSIIVKQILSSDLNIYEMNEEISKLRQDDNYYNPKPEQYEKQFNMNESHNFNVLLQYANIQHFPTIIENNLKKDLNEIISYVYNQKIDDFAKQDLLKSLRLIEMQGQLKSHDVYHLFDELSQNLTNLLYFYIIQVKIFHIVSSDKSFMDSLDKKYQNSTYIIYFLKAYLKRKLKKVDREYMEVTGEPSIEELVAEFKDEYTKEMPYVEECFSKLRK